MNELAYRSSRILRALGNPLRYRILAFLARFPSTPGQLALQLNRPLFVVSHHLALLRALDLVWFHPVDRVPVYSVKYRIVRVLLLVAERCARRLRAADPGREAEGMPPGAACGPA
jgi:DNA-binding transcriptional ArsR family regulator